MTAANARPPSLVRITRKAVTDLQAFGDAVLHRLLPELANVHLGPRRKLTGVDELYRTRQGNFRIIWRRQDEAILVLGVFRRQENTYRLDRLQSLAQVVDDGTPLTLEQQRDACDEADARTLVSFHCPAALLAGRVEEKAAEGYVYGDYRFYPHLDRWQRDRLRQIRERLSGGSGGSCLVQSGPGTGKTLCALGLAEEILRETEGHVHLILPANLLAELRKASKVADLEGQHPERLFLTDWRGWVERVSPELGSRAVPATVELEVMRELLHTSGLGRRSTAERDLGLFQAFVQPDREISREVTFRDNADRISELRDRRLAERFRQKVALHPAVSADPARAASPLARHDLARALAGREPEAPGASEMCVIIDEAQDLLLEEHRAVEAVLKRWADQHDARSLRVILGDLYQRITPNGYTWNHLGLGNSGFALTRNYRNTRRIIAFSKRFLHELRSLAAQRDARHLPGLPDETQAVEEGEPVRVVVYGCRKDATEFLRLAHRRGKAMARETYLSTKSAQAKVLWPAGPSCDTKDLSGVTVYTARQAKGLEFASGIAFGLFDACPGSESQWLFERYTLLTRVQSRLLVVTSGEELQSVRWAEDALAACAIYPVASAGDHLDWVLEEASAIDVCENPAEVGAELLSRCAEGQPFLDTYRVLDRAGIRHDEWERLALSVLRQVAPQDLLRQEHARPVGDPRLRCLIRRAAGYSWRAAESAWDVRTTHPGESQRLLSAIAEDLEAHGLPDEARRLLGHYRDAQASVRGASDGRPPEPVALVSALLFGARGRVRHQLARLRDAPEAGQTGPGGHDEQVQ